MMSDRPLASTGRLIFCCALAFMVHFLQPGPANAQFVPMCQYAQRGSGNRQFSGQPASPLVRDMVWQITSLMRIPPIAVYRSPGLQNASASRHPFNGSAVILYDPQFFNRLHQSVEARGLTRSGRWATFSVLAHEVGHHFHGDAAFYGQFQHPWNKELRADYFSGVVLRRAGASLNDALAAIFSHFNPYGSPSHPDTRRRIDAIRAGYFRG